jgi:hypothetical protein
MKDLSKNCAGCTIMMFRQLCWMYKYDVQACR